MAIVLTWLEAGEIRHVALSSVPGTGHDAALPTHAAFRFQHGRAFVENSGEGYPLHLNGRPLDGASEIADGDVIHAGPATLHVHDVSSVRAPGGGITCRHCGRENGTAQDLCWHCGARVVNAPTVPMVARRAVCRVVPPEGLCVDLFQGDSLDLAEGRAVRGAFGGRPALEARDAGPPWLVAGGDAERNGAAIDGECAVTNGDLLRHGERTYLVLLP